jgi:hypothetical protein
MIGEPETWASQQGDIRPCIELACLWVSICRYWSRDFDELDDRDLYFGQPSWHQK